VTSARHRAPRDPAIAVHLFSRAKGPDTHGVRPSKYRPDVEGLRAVAVALVVLNHAGVSRLGGGYVGVDVFFVISGFLITGLLVREQETKRRISIVSFYARRARRILPASCFTIVATVITSYFVLGSVRANDVANDARWASVFAANVHFGFESVSYFARGNGPSPLQHFWSLGVEEQFYVVWPLFLIVISLLAKNTSFRAKATVLLSVILVASFLWSVHQTNEDANWA
jgi:peptidoglycan/LPS O-acetylase OafA/YrhL